MNDGCFKKGHKPWNAGVKGIHLHPDTEFKKGEMVGKDHYSWKGGVQVVKNDCVYLNVGANQRVRRPRKVYEDAYGKITKGWILYHLDRDSHNDDLDNLIAIPRAVLVRINSGRMNANYHEIKEAVEQFKKKKKMNKFECSECGTKYSSPETTPPPGIKWSDGHVCTPKSVNK